LARDIMATDVIAVSPGTPLSEVERILSENRITGMPVVDSSGMPIGVISVQDLMDRYSEDPDARPRRERGGYFRMSMEELIDERFEEASPPSASEEKAGDLMTTDIVDVPADATVREVARKMARRSVHRVLVTDPRTGRMVGIIGSLAVLDAVSR
jgi:CBS domain-containing protein